ncbi:MAG TPA: carboxypeptidase regulatory-like domain-containing protein [Longimicrobiaceae bacterium]|nr:carboxypeptidase regulatory-like domain-containing protein [Longimicrobiaceae bacterium]
MLRIALLLLLCLAPPLAGQAVRGSVVDEVGGTPVARALVLLMDEAGNRRAGALTGPDGRFLLAAPAPGSYTLRAERVGHESAVSPVLALRAGETLEHRLAAPSRQVVLDGITVRAPSARGCRVRPEVGLATAALWEEARKALNAAAWARDARQFTYDVARFDRELEPGSLRVVSESRRTSQVVTTHPFASIPADSLSRHGYVQAVSDGVMYYAPDAHVLLSDTFLDDHCFRVAGDGAEGLVGLAFEPVRGRDVPDVRGVFWLDRRTAELRWLEYGYVGLPRGTPDGDLGGRVEFERLPNGAWFVSRWSIRMPKVVREMARMREVTGSTAGAPHTRERLARIQETGGEVSIVAARAPAPARLALSGTVYDSLRAAPLAGASVFLSGTVHRATTDAEGRFRIEDVPEGEYSVSFSHPSLASLGVAPAVRTVVLRQGGAAVDLAVSPAPRLAAELCPGLGEARSALVGAVRDAAGEPVRDARVVLSWERGGRAEVVSDAQGVYRACGVPGGAKVTAEVRSAGLAAARAEVRLAAGPLAVHDLRAGDAVRLGADGRPVPLDPVRVTAGSGTRGAGDTRLRLDAQEIGATPARTAYDAVERLRPEWLRTRGLQATSLGTRGRDGVVTSTGLVTNGEQERLVTRQSVGVDQAARTGGGVQAPAGLGQSEIAVYVDGTRMGGTEELRRVPAASVATVEYLDGPSATIRFGTGHAQGAIVVTTRLR